MTSRYVAVVGPAEATGRERQVARRLGELLARRGAVVVCGGLGGVMGAASEGARAQGGTTVGLLPGRDRRAGDPSLTVAIATGLGELRNGLVVAAADAVVAVGGSWGTLSEVALALRTGKPVVVVGGWDVRGPGPGETFLRAASAEEAADAVEAALAESSSGG
ncbi:TIGR00725 family protein [Actinacidiphila glaucinigra]|uniref:TIGR00725 family protein n=1 Tax=Actinacidiphila glaucinigra TaxID=235986 RepID=UPI0029A216F2|nr:TIGR00725 family protein [Streptomyces sp. PA03-3a]